MALTSSYLVTTKNVESFFNSLITAKAPEAFTQKFIESLEFKSTNDRLYKGVLRGLGFIDENDVPRERYFKFLDQTQSKKILAEAIREAYEDLFAVNTKAETMTADEVKNKLRTLTQGKYSDDVLRLMANTFVALVNYADWSEPKKDIKTPSPPDSKPDDSSKTDDIKQEKYVAGISQFHYNIQIHLPESRDPAVYDVLFKALKQHLS
jgi:hypothetical protein